MDKSTVVMVPRESFSETVGALESLFETIPETTPVIVVMGGLPHNISDSIRELRKKRDFRFIERDEFVLAPEARNIALEFVDTEYTVFCDNDLVFHKNWLKYLEENADRNGSGAVAPLTLIGPSKNVQIHHAGSEISIITDNKGRLRLRSIHRLDGMPFRDAEEKDFFDISEEHDEFEYHCALLRTSVIREIGGHDERQTTHDHLNDALNIKARGHKITFEKHARAMYKAFRTFQEEDWPFFFHRWSFENSRTSDRLIGECWGAAKNYEDTTLNFVRMHHKRAVATVAPDWMKKIRPARVKSVFLGVYAHMMRQKYAPKPRKDNLIVPPPPARDALEIAGIKGASALQRH